jgi:hypothetical protein
VSGPTSEIPKPMRVTACSKISNCAKDVLFIAPEFYQFRGRSQVVSRTKLLPQTQHTRSPQP